MFRGFHIIKPQSVEMHVENYCSFLFVHLTIYVGCIGAINGGIGQLTCKQTPRGREFIGTINQTISGITCQRWDQQTPHRHSRNNPTAFPDATLADAGNKCRNPDGEPGGPWCYTTDPRTRWQYCKVTLCQVQENVTCKVTPKGEEYIGPFNQTYSGIICQRWGQQIPHSHNQNQASSFPDATLADAGNKCRNPDGEHNGPWCYTTDPNVRWQNCYVPFCPVIGELTCRVTTRGKEYTGSLSQTNTGKTCQRWDQQTPHSHSRNQASSFPDPSLTDAGNKCRNPDNEPYGPWCYTTDPSTRWQYCNVPYCSVHTCKVTKKGGEYIGYLSQTFAGKTCQRWDHQTPHRHSRNRASSFPDATLADAGNKCRNPDGEPSGPWCYTTDPNTRWQFCNVPYCQEYIVKVTATPRTTPSATTTTCTAVRTTTPITTTPATTSPTTITSSTTKLTTLSLKTNMTIRSSETATVKALNELVVTTMATKTEGALHDTKKGTHKDHTGPIAGLCVGIGSLIILIVSIIIIYVRYKRKIIDYKKDTTEFILVDS